MTIKNIAYQMPKIGDVVDDFGNKLIVVAVLCPATSLGMYPSFFAVSKEALKDYFVMVNGIKIRGSNDFIIKMGRLFNETTSIQKTNSAEGMPKRIFEHISVINEPHVRIIGEYNFNFPTSQKKYLTEKAGLGEFFEIDRCCFVVDGYFLVGEEKKPEVMINMHNYNATNLINLDVTVRINNLLSKHYPVRSSRAKLSSHNIRRSQSDLG